MPSLLQQFDTPLHQGLAIESALLDSGMPLPLLFLWTGPASVVMGKNQNPWRECDLTWMKENHIPLARRISGGGSVYHDPGNLNVSFLLDRATYNSCETHRWVVSALQDLGVPATIGANGSLLVNDKKISGSAFCYRKNKVLHHCTLLLDADLTNLQRALTPPANDIQTHAVASVPASVINLRQHMPSLTRTAVCEALVTTCATAWEDSLHPISPPAVDTAPFAEKAWLWDQTPQFEFRIPAWNWSATVRKGKLLRSTSGDPDGRDFSPDLIPCLAEEFKRPPEIVAADLRANGISWL